MREKSPHAELHAQWNITLSLSLFSASGTFIIQTSIQKECYAFFFILPGFLKNLMTKSDPAILKAKVLHCVAL